MAYAHPSRAPSIRWYEGLTTTPRVEISSYIDAYGNLCGRANVPAGRVIFRTDAQFEDSGLPDPQSFNVWQHGVGELPSDLACSCSPAAIAKSTANCEIPPGRCSATAGRLAARAGGVQFRPRHIRFDYLQARANRTALDVYRERAGVCRDYMHLAITFAGPSIFRPGIAPDTWATSACRRRLTRWISAPGSRCILGGQWHTFDARNNTPHRPGADGPRPRCRRRGADDHVRREINCSLFRVWTDEVLNPSSL